MAGVASDDSGGGRSFDGGSSEQYQAGEALAEWRSSEQVENGIPSTSPPYWDSDDDDDGGPKPSDLYGKYTWKIDKFNQVNKRELRSNAFEVGGYKWYILIYPQGCDVCNHISLFLCVANHDKLLPGWSHFAQFTIAVVNKDPKKSKYSDTLHRFWKKEHDWGWKKFMELTKVKDGFIDAENTLIIKAQVQVIRERAERPFRCLDCQYRRELVRVYLTNVEQICRRFVEERRSKLLKLIDDKARWSSFSAFWGDMDESSKFRMAREKSESILKVVVKHFFIEKEVTSTLVMDSLYSGLKALVGQYKETTKVKQLGNEEYSAPIVRMDEDMFVLDKDVLLLLKRAATAPLPPKDDKGPQNRTKDGTPGEEFNRDSIERDERRLTELGRRTIEIFILAHIFSKIEVAYQEAVALKRQEELIREEEAAWLADIEHKARRGVADKEKKSKKKQGKQKRNNRKGKDKSRDDKSNSVARDKIEEEEDIIDAEPERVVIETPEAVEDDSDVSDSIDRVPEILPPDSEDTDTSEVHPPTEASSSVQNGTEGRSSSVVDDSSSTCSSDSVPSVAIPVSQKVNSRNHKNKKSPISSSVQFPRGRNYQSKVMASETAELVNEEPSQLSEAAPNGGRTVDASRSSKVVESLSRVPDRSFQERMVNGAKRHVGKKEEETAPVNVNIRAKDADVEVPVVRSARVTSPPRSRSENVPSIAAVNLESKLNNVGSDLPTVKKPSSNSPKQANRSAVASNSAENTAASKPETPKLATPKMTEKPSTHKSHTVSEKPPPTTQHVTTTASTAEKPTIPPIPVMSRPLSAPLIPGPRPSVSVVSGPHTQTAPVLARSVSAIGRLGQEPTAGAAGAGAPSFQSYVPQSYRNAIVGSPSPAYTQNYAPSSSISYPQLYPDRVDPNQMKPGFSFGMLSHHHHHEMLQNAAPPPPQPAPPLWMEMPSFDSYVPVHSRINHEDQLPAGASTDEFFPHLDIINDLLDDESGSSSYQAFGGPHYLNRHYSFPGGGDPPGMPGGAGSSCRFERTRSYPDEGVFQHSYGAPVGTTYDALRDGIVPPQAAGPPRGGYMNGGQIGGFYPNQWQVAGSDSPYVSVRNADNNNDGGYPYHHHHHHVTDYQNVAGGVNGYTVFRPSSGL
ncbi:hypothetical protein ABFX02_07G042100 [Erythranthe guttata]